MEGLGKGEREGKGEEQRERKTNKKGEREEKRSCFGRETERKEPRLKAEGRFTCLDGQERK